MAEGNVIWSVMPTPNWDQFSTVTLTAGSVRPGGGGGAHVYSEVSTAYARRFAAEILNACDIVDKERQQG